VSWQRGLRRSQGTDDISPQEPTRFSFPSRHHQAPPSAPSTFRASFNQPTGLHPTLRLTFPTAAEPPSEGCGLHAYLTLPSTFFADKYQLSAPLFLASKNLRSIRSLSGETDLEAPDWVVKKWGSAMLVELAPPGPEGEWRADVPLHLRYLAPAPSGLAPAEMPWPAVFWACRAEEGTKMGVNPFDRRNVGYDGLFGPKTMFYHVAGNSSAGSLVERLEVPVLHTDRGAWVEAGTIAIILAGFLWVVWRLGGAALRPRDSKEKSS
jgi:hypothetical protein